MEEKILSMAVNSAAVVCGIILIHGVWMYV